MNNNNNKKNKYIKNSSSIRLPYNSNSNSNNNNNNYNNDNVVTLQSDRQKRKLTSFDKSILKRKKQKINHDNNSSGNNKTQKSNIIVKKTKKEISPKELKKKLKRRLLYKDFTRNQEPSSSFCNYKKLDGKKCKNKTKSKQQLYCKQHIYHNNNNSDDGNNNDTNHMIQCRGVSRFKRQCLRAVSINDIFCKSHLTPIYKSYIKQLKENKLSPIEIANHEYWSWSPSLSPAPSQPSTTITTKPVIETSKITIKLNNTTTTPTKEDVNKKIDQDKPKIDDDVEKDIDFEIPFDFTNNSTKRLEIINKNRNISCKLKNKPKAINVPKKKRIRKPSSKLLKQLKEQEEQDLEQTPIDMEVTPPTSTSPSITTPKPTPINIVEQNKNTFFNNVSNLLDDLGWLE